MKLLNHFTTPEQSKRLLKLGVPRWSADEYRDQKGYRHSLEGILDVELFFQNFPDYLPCWSVGRLIKILKRCIIDKRCLREIFEELEMCVDEAKSLVQAFYDYGDVIDFSKLEE